MFTVSQSKIKTWRRCRRQYYYKYVEKIARKLKNANLLRGSIIHDMLEAHIDGKKPWKIYDQWLKKQKKLFKEEVEEYGDLPLMVKLLMENYFRFYKKDPLKYLKFQGKRSEFEFNIDLCPGINIQGKLDTVAQNKSDDRLWLTEHKTHKQIPISEFKFTDIQSGIYTTIMPRIDMPEPDGVAWNYIRAKCPAVPDLLKSEEGLSKRANIDTMWPVYEAEIKAHGFKMKDYKDMKENLQGKENDFFSRIYLPISKHFQKELLRDTISTAKEMKAKGGKRKERCIDKHCEWCDFKDLCRAELLGLDAKHIRKHNFVAREKRYV